MRSLSLSKFVVGSTPDAILAILLLPSPKMTTMTHTKKSVWFIFHSPSSSSQASEPGGGGGAGEVDSRGRMMVDTVLPLILDGR